MIRQEIKSFRMDHAEYKGLTCTPPCSVLSVLRQHSLIPDPFFGENVQALAGVLAEDCSFTAEFSVDMITIGMRRVLLRLGNIDTLCSVELNGAVIGSTDNMHRTYTFDVKSCLRPGLNKLTLRIRSASRYIESCQAEDRGSISEGQKAGASRLRKAYYMSGSAYSPNLPDMGILGSVELVAFNGRIIDSVCIRQEHTRDDVTLYLELDTLGDSDGARAVATLRSPGSEVLFSGFAGGRAIIKVANPEYWYPSSLGVPNLYKLTVTLYEGSEIEDVCTMNVGLRTIDASFADGELRLSVCGTPFVAMGAVLLPYDSILASASPSVAVNLVADARRAGINLLHLHGCGGYADERLLDILDEQGILLWQDLPVSYADIPLDGAMTENVRRELIEFLRRASHHPCLAIIGGGTGLSSMQDSLAEGGSVAYSLLCESVFPDLVREMAPHVFYLPSSSPTKDLRSFPSLKTALSFADKEDVNILSSVMELHDSTGEGNIAVTVPPASHYLYPESYQEISYLTQLYSAETLRRRAIESRIGFSRGRAVVISTLNEPWPSVSSSLVDYYGRPKIGHYYAARFFAPVLANAEADGTRVEFSAANDTFLDYYGTLTYTILDNTNATLLKDSIRVHLSPMSSETLLVRDFAEIVGKRKDRVYLHYILSDSVTRPSEGTVLFTEPKRFDFIKPEIRWELVGNGTSFTLTVSSSVFVKGLFVDFAAGDCILEDNCFDICESTPRRIRVISRSPYAVETLRNSINMISLYDVGRSLTRKTEKKDRPILI